MEQVPTQPQGINLDPEILIQTQNNFIGQARIKEVQMEAAIAQLMMENEQLKTQLEPKTGVPEQPEEHMTELMLSDEVVKEA